jgi:aspartyl-tRNA synthetase
LPDFTRTTNEELTRKAQGYGAKGMAWIAIRPDGELYSILTKYLTPEELKAIGAGGGRAGRGNLSCSAPTRLPTVPRVLGGLRL